MKIRNYNIKDYENVLEWKKQGFSVSEIAKITNINQSTIRRWNRRGVPKILSRKVLKTRFKSLKKAHSVLKQKRKKELEKLSNKITDEFAYSLGALIGDGFISFPRIGGGWVGLSVKDKDFAEYFKEKIDKWSRKKSRLFFYRGFWKVHLTSVVVATVFKKFDIKKIVTYTMGIKCMFLKGLFDSEGTVDLKAKTIRFYNSDLKLINIVRNLLESIGIETRLLKRESEIHRIEGREFLVKPVYCIYISRYKNIKTFYENIEFSILRKQKILRSCLETYSYVPEKWTKKDIELLESSIKLKNLENKSINSISKEIAKDMGMSLSSIRRALYRYKLVGSNGYDRHC